MAAVVWLIVIVLVVLWGIGFFIASLGNLIHFLLVIAVVLAVGYVLSAAGRRPPPRPRSCTGSPCDGAGRHQ